MKPRVWIQLVLLAAIAAVVFLLVQRPREEDRLPGPFDGVSVESVRLIRWIGPDGERTLTRSMSGWSYAGTPASRSRWQRDRGNGRLAIELLRNLDRFRAQRLLQGDRLGDYGLESPTRGLVLETSDGVAETLWVGAATPVDRGRYATWRGLRPGAAVVDGFLVEKFVVGGDDKLRDPKLGLLGIGEVDSAWVATRRDTFSLLSDEEGWRVRLPSGSYRADSLACKRAVNTLLRLQAIHFLYRADHPSGADVGLDPPRARWILAKGTRRDTFLVGDRITPENLMYVQAGERPPAQTQDDNWSYLVSDAGAFRNPSLFAADDTHWEEVRLVSGGETLGRLRREGDHWVPDEGLPELGGPDPLRMWTTSVANLARLRFIGYRDPPAAEPDLLIVVRLQDAREETLRIVIDTEGALAQGPFQPGVWGKLVPQDVALWVRLARRAPARPH